MCINKNLALPSLGRRFVLAGRKWASELPSVQMPCGWDAETVTKDAKSLSVAISERLGSGHCVARAGYVAGCDGNRSFVREQAGITLTRTDRVRMMVLLVSCSHRLHELLERFPSWHTTPCCNQS